MNEKEYSWMNAWMHDNARIHGDYIYNVGVEGNAIW
jgi:hypothetical protein